MALTEHAEDWVPRDTFASRLALIRNHMGWNVKEAALACGVTHQSWHNWESGKNCQTLPEVCRKIADATGCDYRWLIAGGPVIRWSSDAPALTCVNDVLGQMELAFVPDRALALAST